MIQTRNQYLQFMLAAWGISWGARAAPNDSTAQPR